jgi:hypothetical protein
MRIRLSRQVVGYGLLAGLLALPVGSRAWAQAGPVTDSNIAERVAQMKTPAEHQAIAAYYQSKAAAASAEVARHQAMLKGYENLGNPAKQMARHCTALMEAAQKEKAEYETLAKEHADMAAATK